MSFNDKTFISRTAVEHELDISKFTIRNWIRDRGFPNPVPRSGRVPIFRTIDIINWLEDGGSNDG